MAIVIKAGPQDSNDQLIKKFKKRVQQDQILTKLKEKEFYRKPSLVKKERRKEVERRLRKERRFA